MPISRRTLLSSSLLAMPVLALPALAALPPGFSDYSKEKFADALKDPKPIMVHVHADWCPVCVRQEKAFQQLTENADFKRFRAFQVNFDMDLDFRKTYGVNNQSVILIFKGNKEVARIGGVTDPAKIGEFLASVK